MTMLEGPVRCPFVYEDGEQCADNEGHEEYAMACGHLRMAPRSEPRPVVVEGPRARHVAPLGRMAAIAMVLAAGMGHMPGAPSRPRLDPLPPPPDPEAIRKVRASSMYGRVGGAQPVPRAFYSGRLLPGEDPAENGRSLVDEFDRSMQRQRDLEALRLAAEKRERKAKKRKGG